MSEKLSAERLAGYPWCLGTDGRCSSRPIRGEQMYGKCPGPLGKKWAL